jgi:hypothetical protein
MEVTGDGQTPLIVAFCHFAASDIIKLLLNRGPQAVKMKDHYGNYPLHAINRYNNNHDVDLVSQVYNLYPKAIRQMDNEGETPLHFACYDGNHVRFLGEHYSAACLTLNIYDQSPYDVALSFNDQEPGDGPLDTYMAYMTTATKNAASRINIIPADHTLCRYKIRCTVQVQEVVVSLSEEDVDRTAKRLLIWAAILIQDVPLTAL